MSEDQNRQMFNEIETLVRLRSPMFDHVIVELALYTDAGKWRVSFGCLRFLCNEEHKPEEANYDYGIFRLIRRILPVDKGLRLLRMATVDRILEFDDLSDIVLEGRWGNPESLTSGSGYGYFRVDWPTTLWEYNLSDSNVRLPNKPVARSGQTPIYPDPREAVRDFFHFRELDYSDVRQMLLVLIPDFRARIKELRITGKVIRTRIEAKKIGYNDLVYKIYCRTKQETYQSGDLVPSDDEVVYNAPENMIRVMACLMIKGSDELVDWKDVDLRYPHRYEGVVIEESQEMLREVILRGETETVEFKKEPPDPKDLMKAVVAFANTQGGTIFIGVDDDCRIVGFDQDIRSKVQDWAKSHCEPPLDTLMEIDQAEIDAKHIWIIRIREGDNKPYLVRERGIFVRSSGSSRQITRAELDELGSKTSRNFPFIP